MKRLIRKFMAMAIIIAMVLTVTPSVGFASEEGAVVEKPLAQIVAGSDYQNKKGNKSAEKNLKKLIVSMKAAGFDRVDNVFMGGDYTYKTKYRTSHTEAGIKSLRKVFKEQYKGLTIGQIITVQGNHDPEGSKGLADFGPQDRTEYGVYVLNEDIYMYGKQDKGTCKRAAYDLEAYLLDKAEEGYSKPIFILSHLPLAYSMRTYTKGCALYADYFVDAINEGAAKGLNIIFMYGHDHNNGWDAYLGSGSVYLPAGSTINVCDYSDETGQTYKEEKINFTYMNYGFAGYYRESPGNTEEDRALTMTGFRIYSDRVEIVRCDSSGLHALKSAGSYNYYLNEPAYVNYQPDTRIIKSPQTILLNQEINTSVSKGENPYDFEGTNISKLIRTKKGFIVKWKDVENCDGYEIRYDRRKSMYEAEKIDIEGTHLSYARIGDLKKKKTYYVQIRTYKKEGGKKYYSYWSKTKSVKTR